MWFASSNERAKSGIFTTTDNLLGKPMPELTSGRADLHAHGKNVPTRQAEGLPFEAPAAALRGKQSPNFRPPQVHKRHAKESQLQD